MSTCVREAGPGAKSHYSATNVLRTNVYVLQDARFCIVIPYVDVDCVVRDLYVVGVTVDAVHVVIAVEVLVVDVHVVREAGAGVVVVVSRGKLLWKRRTQWTVNKVAKLRGRKGGICKGLVTAGGKIRLVLQYCVY